MIENHRTRIKGVSKIIANIPVLWENAKKQLRLIKTSIGLTY